MAKPKDGQVQVVEKPKWYAVNLRFLPVKGFYFFMLAAIGDLLPFIPLYMKQIKLSSAETGIIYGVMPFIGFLMKPLFGILSDRTRRHKVILSVCCVFTGFFYVLILVIPTDVTTYTQVKTTIMCSQYDSYISDCYHPNASKKNCPLTVDDYMNLNIQPPSTSREDITLLNNENTTDFTATYKVIDSTKSNRTKYPLLENLKCSFECKLVGDGMQESSVCFTDSVEDLSHQSCKNESRTITKKDKLHFQLPDMSSVAGREVTEDRQTVGSMVCNDFDMKGIKMKKQNYWQMLCSKDTELECDLMCSAGKDKSCIQRKSEDSKEMFLLFLVIYLFGNIAFSPIMSLGDAMAYDVLGPENRNRWGKQRLWGTIGFALFALTSTFIMDQISKNSKDVDYSISFYVFGVLCVCTVVVTCFMPISEDLVCNNMLKNVGQLLKHAKISIFLIVILYFGMMTGVIEAFLYWYLSDLGNHLQIIPGLCVLMNCFSETILLFLAGYIIKRIGHLACLYMVFVAYGLRFLAYSFITNAWHALPIELLHGVTFGIMWAATTSYASIITPPGLSATIQGLLSGIHFGFGKGIGALVTGLLYTSLGSRWTFRFYGILSLVLFVLYFLINYCCFRERSLDVNRGVGKDDTVDELQDLESPQSAGNKLLDEKGDQDKHREI